MPIDVMTFDPAPARGKIAKVTQGAFTAEAKLDGVRMIFAKIDGVVTMTGRRTSKVTGQKLEKSEMVPHLVEAMKNMPGDWVLDGELVIEGISTSNDVVSIIGSKPEKALAKQKQRGNLYYIVFDVLVANGEDIRQNPYQARKERRFHAVDLLHRYPTGKYFAEVPELSERQFPSLRDSALIDKGLGSGSAVFIDEAFALSQSNGYEGLILKSDFGIYAQQEWAKVKPEATFDMVICGVEHSESDTFMGNGIAALQLGLYNKYDKLVPVTDCSGMTHHWRREFYNNTANYIGMVVEVTAQEIFPDTGALRHPRFKRLRPDAEAEAQTYEKYGVQDG